MTNDTDSPVAAHLEPVETVEDLRRQLPASIIITLITR